MKRKIFDAPLALFVIALLLCAVWFPFGLRIARGNTPFSPQLEKPAAKTACIENVEFMRSSHMSMLDTWRTDVVRSGNRKYLSQAGITYNKSLTKTCVDCHGDEQKFCGACHQSMGVSYNCFSCHAAKNKE